MIEKERLKYLNNNTLGDGYVLYWMQNAQRTEYNHALEYAIKRANDLNKPLVVMFFLITNYPSANYRHYSFMIDGLKEVEESLKKRNIKFVAKLIDAKEDILSYLNSSLIIVDKGYMRFEKEWRAYVSSNTSVPLIEVETNVLVPIEEVSNKEEYGAYTIRNKINKHIGSYAKELEIGIINISSLNLDIDSVNLNNVLDNMKLEYVPKSTIYIGGTSNAKKHLDEFINNKIMHYEERNNPKYDYQSNLSPYLHFGQISPLYIYLKTKDISPAFTEELIVRRELSYNFVYYNNNYDNYKCLPDWAVTTLEKHMVDKRPYIYDLNTLEQYLTFDEYWNTCQKEMVITGKMHGYMRMYWGKKIIEWSNTPYEAFNTMIYLNDKYSIDGRDPNSYAGIAWCFGKHDRPWTERNIFGMIRYMNSSGLDRKFDMEDYVSKWRKYE
jgi:deoxyribodipyrimidine photo-lyase